MAEIHTMHNTKAGRVFDVCNILFLGGVGAITILPFLYIIAGSFATEAELAQRSFFIFPKTFTLDAYKYVFSTPTFLRSMGVSIFITVVGTAVQLFFTFTMAYPLAKRHVKGRNLLLNLVIFSMLFSGGMIPTYLVVKSLGLLDTYWALILPMAINPFNLIIIKNFFQQLPRELEESAKIDGCSEIGVFWRIDQEQYEAAIMDGAGRFRRMWHITLPAIRSTIIVLLILRIGSFLNLGFEQVYLMTNSLNRSVADIFDTYVYMMGITQGAYSYSTAVGLFKSVVGIILIFGANYIAKKFDRSTN